MCVNFVGYLDDPLDIRPPPAIVDRTQLRFDQRQPQLHLFRYVVGVLAIVQDGVLHGRDDVRYEHLLGVM